MGLRGTLARGEGADMPQSGYEFRLTRRREPRFWELALPGCAALAYGPIVRGQHAADAMRRARHRLGYTPCRTADLFWHAGECRWEVPDRAQALVACGNWCATSSAARRGLGRARAAARGARIVTK